VFAFASKPSRGPVGENHLGSFSVRVRPFIVETRHELGHARFWRSGAYHHPRRALDRDNGLASASMTLASYRETPRP